MSLPILDEYTPMSFADLLFLMEQYPDICIITDTKFTDTDVVVMQFQAMLSDAAQLGLSYLFDRIAIQVYNDFMFRAVDNLYHFPYYIYTLYTVKFDKTEDGFREVAEYCVENGIMAITMDESRWSADFAPLAEEYGVEVYVHTVDDADYAAELLEGGVSGIYTNVLSEADILSPESAAED
jgi:glycerophosphoryl diester phosphodiesterase